MSAQQVLHLGTADNITFSVPPSQSIFSLRVDQIPHPSDLGVRVLVQPILRQGHGPRSLLLLLQKNYDLSFLVLKHNLTGK